MIRPNAIALLTLLSMGPLALACSPSLLRVKAVAAPVVAVAPVAVTFPTYGASVAPQQAVASDDVLRQILEELRAIRAALGNAPVQAGPLDAAKLVSGERGCVKCHQAKFADKLGGGFVMAEDDGKVPPFSVNERAKITRRVQAGTMPPAKSGVQLSAAEKSAVIEFFVPKPKE